MPSRYMSNGCATWRKSAAYSFTLMQHTAQGGSSSNSKTNCMDVWTRTRLVCKSWTITKLSPMGF
eukprot:3160059-Karenia_brevis.AAC.1